MDTKTTSPKCTLRLSPAFFKKDRLVPNQYRVSRNTGLHYTTVRDYTDGTRGAKVDLDVIAILLQAGMGLTPDEIAALTIGEVFALVEPDAELAAMIKPAKELLEVA